MNPNSLFGSSQGGAFQAPSNTAKTSLFQSFGQQSSASQPQSMGFFQSAAFGQSNTFNQPSTLGNNNIFGQAPAFGQGSMFGQASTQPSTQPTMNQAPAFGQPSVGQSSSGFSGGSTPAFGQTSGSSQSSLFGQAPAFGQPSAFGQPPGFGQSSSGFGLSAGISKTVSGSTTTSGPSQPMSFGPSLFGQPLSTSATSSTFGTAQSVTQSRGFGSSEFSFKPSTEAVFKPIFSASPEPANPQATSGSSQLFGSSAPQTSSSAMESSTTSTTTTTTGFSLLSGAKTGLLGFSFSHPAAAPSITGQSNPLTTDNSSGSTSTLQFTFSQPAAPSSTNTKAATTQPTTPSSFSFSAKVLQPQTAPLFEATSFGQTSAFGDPKVKALISTEEKGADQESTGDGSIFARMSKSTKRKEDSVAPSASSESPVKEDVRPGGDAPRHPPKRALLRFRGPVAGLFGRAVSGLMKNTANPVRREIVNEGQQQASEWKDPKKEDSQAQSDHRSATPPRAQVPTREVLEKAEETGESCDITILIYVKLKYILACTCRQTCLKSQWLCFALQRVPSFQKSHL